MAAELGVLVQKLSPQSYQTQMHQSNGGGGSSAAAWMWNPKQAHEEDDSWEVRAFEEDTGNVMGTTWPPRSYTCTFCRREFRSAQALGGHMNVHRRDRARLHQTVLPINSTTTSQPSPTTASTSSSPTFIIPTQEFSTNGGLCLLYQFPNPNACDAAIASPSTLASISPYNNFIGQSISFPVASQPSGAHCYNSTKTEASSSINYGSIDKDNDLVNEELDLELRLGHKSTTSSRSS